VGAISDLGKAIIRQNWGSAPILKPLIDGVRKNAHVRDKNYVGIIAATKGVKADREYLVVLSPAL